MSAHRIAALLLPAIACTDGSADTGYRDGAETESETTDTTTTDSHASDSGTTDPDAHVMVDVEIDVGWFYGRNPDNAWEYMGSADDGEGIVRMTHVVDPGVWWVLAIDPSDTLCAVSQTEDLGPGDTLYWTVSAFPGTFDMETGCSLEK